MNHNTICSARDDIASGKKVLPDIVATYMERVAEINSQVNAFTQLQKEQALEQARQIQKKTDNGTAGPLAGAVFGIKDVLCQEGFPATCASRMLKDFESVYSATVVDRLREQDAVIIGRVNMDEFAMGSSSENSIYGPVRNPHNPEKVAGGSSGGSAAAVAAGMCSAALGSDTGGSIRQPASYCGVVGLKPTYGRVSRYGLIAFASSFDSIGPLTHSVTDAAMVLKAIAGHDSRDATSSTRSVPDYPALLKKPDSGLTVGIPREYFSKELDSEIGSKVMDIARNLEKKGAKLIDVELPHLKYAIATYYILATAEASSNLARFDGIRYGHRADIHEIRRRLKSEQEQLKKQFASEGKDSVALEEALQSLDSPMIRLYKQSRTEGFGPEVKRRIMLGTYVLSAGYYDAYYAKAQRIRRLIKRDFEKAFKHADVLISPTTPSTAFHLGEKVDNPLEMYLNDIYTISANLAGICGISIPAGKHSSDGMPIGVQFMADAFNESGLLNAARSAEITLQE